MPGREGPAPEDLRAEVVELRRLLAASEARFQAIVDRSSDGVLVVADDGRILFANPAAVAMLRRPVGDLVGQDVGFPVVAGEVTEIELIRPARDVMYAELRVVESVWEGRPCRLALLRDATARHDVEAELSHRATHDQLTGLPNRYLLYDRLTQSLARLDRDAGSVALLIADLDDFKAVNDRFGHLAGDAVLTEWARRLSSLIRPADTAARLGGDEFALVCEAMDEGAAEALLERLDAASSRPIRGASWEVTVGISIGYAIATTAGTTADELVAVADKAMYQSKDEIGPSSRARRS
jgi:diguanylate cyclase (GGDEF)-like protein